jgi:putative membrane-bound dehydrogenase-like protein
MIKLLLAVTLTLSCCLPLPAADKPSGKPVASPVSAFDSLQHFETHPDVTLELIAAEPQVIDPVAIAFDESERLWVVEMRDYPNGPAKGELPRSRIKILRDNDGDGYYETATVFVDNLLFVTGVLPYKGGVIVTHSGEITYMRDTSGNDRVDTRETWFHGFAEQNPQLRANHPTLGLDGWVYVSNGLRGGSVVAVKPEWAANAEKLDLARVDFRFHPETGRYEGITGTGQFGLSFDDFGNRFTCSNRNPCMHVVLEQSELAQNPLVRIASLREDVSPAGEHSRVYAITDAWTTSTLHAGQFTAACGVTIYRGDALPAEFYGNSFTCEPTGSLVHRDLLTPRGATFSSRYARPEQEFLASRDSWFRPVSLSHGPDGGLYVCDMYRAVIEHPQFMPDELKQRPDLSHGNDRGRIYRITSKAPSERDRPANLAGLSTAELVKLVAHSNVWQRETAVRLIAERDEKSAIPLLKQTLLDAVDDKTSIAALWLLQRLEGFSADIERKVLAQGSPLVIEQLLQSKGERLFISHYLFPKLLELAEIDNGALRFRLALIAGRLADVNLGTRLLIELTRNADDDPWLQQAALISAHHRPNVVLEELLSSTTRDNRAVRTGMIQSLAALIGQRFREPELNSALEQIAREFDDPETTGHVRGALLHGLGEGLRRQKQTLKQQLAQADPAVQAAADQTFAEAIRSATTFDQHPADQRAGSLELLAFHSGAATNQALEEVIERDPAIPNRQRAIELWTANHPAQAAGRLLADFESRTPALRSTILSVLAQSPASVPPLLDALEEKRIALGELSPIQQRLLQRHKQPELKSRIDKLLANAGSPDRKQVLEKYQASLTLESDPRRGRIVFQKNCIACHRIGELGVNVAPDIADSRTAKPEKLLVDILDPNRAIDNNYFSYTIVLTSGKVLTGIIATETGNSVTLKQPENKTVTILKDEIDEMRSDGVSLMPVGLEKNISIQEMADLISFIKNWRYLDGNVPIDVGEASR